MTGAVDWTVIKQALAQCKSNDNTHGVGLWLSCVPSFNAAPQTTSV